MHRRLGPPVASLALCAVLSGCFGGEKGHEERRTSSGTARGPVSRVAPDRASPKQTRRLLRVAVERYVSDVGGRGGPAVCERFPREYVALQESPLPRATSPVMKPHPAPVGGCRNRRPPGFSMRLLPRWLSTSLVRIEDIRRRGRLARVRIRVRARYRPPDTPQTRGPVPREKREYCQRERDSLAHSSPGSQQGGSPWERLQGCPGPQPPVPASVFADVVWLSIQDGRWQVAKPSLLVDRIFEYDAPSAEALEPPATAAALTRPAKLPRPSFPCRGHERTEPDRSADGYVDRRRGGAPPWVDITRVTIARENRAFCLRIKLRASVRPGTRLDFYAEQTEGESTLGEPRDLTVRLDARGHPHAGTSQPPPDRPLPPGNDMFPVPARVAAKGAELWVLVRRPQSFGLNRRPMAWYVNLRWTRTPGKSAGDAVPEPGTRRFLAYPTGGIVSAAPGAR